MHDYSTISVLIPMEMSRIMKLGTDLNSYVSSANFPPSIHFSDFRKQMVAWTPQVTGKPSLPLLVAMQNAVLATRAPGSETDTIRWKLVIRSWSSLVFDSYCPSPDPLFPDCPDVINLGSTQVCFISKGVIQKRDYAYK